VLLLFFGFAGAVHFRAVFEARPDFSGVASDRDAVDAVHAERFAVVAPREALRSNEALREVFHQRAFVRVRHALTSISRWASRRFSLLLLSEKKPRRAFPIARRMEVPSAATFSDCGPHFLCFHRITHL
jgi:hypothetical protein